MTQTFTLKQIEQLDALEAETLDYLFKVTPLIEGADNTNEICKELMSNLAWILERENVIDEWEFYPYLEDE